MKKAFLILIILFVVLVSSCKGEGFELYIQDNVEYMINPKKKIGFIGQQCWNCDLDNASLHIADEVEGCKITSFGGYYGIGALNYFAIHLDYSIPNISFFDKEGLPKECEKIEIPFRIYMNKYLERVKLCGQIEEYFIFDDSPNTAYYITYYFICSEENATFYSNDGKLYYKSNDTLVKEFYDID